MNAMKSVVRHAQRIAAGKDKVKPGMPARFTEASTPGDLIWQGDLGVEIVAAVPADYVEVKAPNDADRQLVPGNTQGSRHCLRSLDGVRLFRPKDWGGESLQGPVLVLARETTIDHPTHGAVTIPAGFVVQCRYQRVWDQEQRQIRRSQD